MDIQGLKPKEIQQLIFTEIENGAKATALKQELKDKGVPVEGYYFTTEAKLNDELVLDAGPETSSHVSGWQVFLGIVSIIILVVRIARCNSRM